ncbi:glycerol-3-phosphate dehydrogenase [Pseudooceanicola sp. C21-150M6]|uniref:glycerol-3-phosphate dehydrogenase n=1 Tax=Pseudooceanicola sp. C21-150M6 TaxID=3434355 RepID=UPI003D7F9404
MTDDTQITDLFVIGGGINGCAIARDAAGRGLTVRLAERNDLGWATSSASTKLFHGGLRYLEYFEFRLVREALREREVLLQAMPHIAWPMRFVLPYHRDMRFETDTPAARLLGRVMPWTRGRRPAWLIRGALALYDTLGGRSRLPRTRTLSLTGTAEGAPLQPRFEHAFEYSDGWVDDARLVVLNARDAAARGARLMLRTEVISAEREESAWLIRTRNCDTDQIAEHRAHMVVNAAGPWASEVLKDRLNMVSTDRIRLVRGSHIVVPRLYEHNKCYFLQGTDGRIIFAIPYETDFTLIGTTDADHPDAFTPPHCTEEERDYLLSFANRYFRQPLTADDVVWSYAGMRPLHDDGTAKASAATRDYTLKLDTAGGAPLLNVFGGKITTYRKLAENALTLISRHLAAGPAWTAGAALPGGDFPVDQVAELIAGLRADYSFLTAPWAARLVRAYGTEARSVLGAAQTAQDLGTEFGATLTEAELDWMMSHEFARTAEDALWRRSKLGLRMTPDQVRSVERWMAGHDVQPGPAGPKIN